MACDTWEQDGEDSQTILTAFWKHLRLEHNMKDSQKFALEAPGSQLGPFLENWNGPPACSSIPRRSPAGKVILQTKLFQGIRLDTLFGLPYWD